MFLTIKKIIFSKNQILLCICSKIKMMLSVELIKEELNRKQAIVFLLITWVLYKSIRKFKYLV